MKPYATVGSDVLYLGDSRQVVPAVIAPESVDAVVTDAPYELGFMGKRWDATGVAFDPATWRVALDATKPGGHLVAFGGTRTWHRMAVAIEDAGWEIRDTLVWMYGSGFPKSLEVSKAIDKAAGVERPVVGSNPNFRRLQKEPSAFNLVRNRDVTAPATDAARLWEGWGTALKPAFEPIILARKPLQGTVAANVLEHGTGALNIDGCRIAGLKGVPASLSTAGPLGWRTGGDMERKSEQNGRWPANVILGCACEGEGHEPGCAVRLLDEQSGTLTSGANPTRRSSNKFGGIFSGFEGQAECTPARGADSGGASRFFYTAKASRGERTLNGAVANSHATVKPLDLMRYLVRLVTPKGGTVLDLFTGSGTTWLACGAEGFGFVGVELLPEHADIAVARRREQVGPLFTAEVV